MENPPPWLTTVADIFPLRPFAQSFQDGFNPLVEGSGWVSDRVLRIAIWGVIGTVAAVRWFRWEPTPSRGSPQPSCRGPCRELNRRRTRRFIPNPGW